MPWKQDEQGNYVERNGNLLWIGADGEESEYDPVARGQQIAELTAKAARRKEELESMQAKYKSVEDIEDLASFVATAKKNAETVSSLKDKDRDTEETVQRRISEAVKAALEPVVRERDKYKTDYDSAASALENEVIGGHFLRSKLVSEQIINPALAKDLFSSRFYVKDGKPVGRDTDGSDMYGERGDLASFDEALMRMVNTSPYGDNLKKSAPGGSGTPNTVGHSGPVAGKLSPEQAGNLSPSDYAKARKEGKI